MAATKKTGLTGTKSVAKKSGKGAVNRQLAATALTNKPLFAKDSPLAKSPYGKLIEVLRDVPAHKIKTWPVEPENSRP